MNDHRSHWQLPPGVEPGTWEYANRPAIADDYDEYFQGHRLFQFDDSRLAHWLPQLESGTQQVVADLGCGTGRALVPLVERGYRGLAIDLSPWMLEQVRRKSDAQSMLPLCANLVQLDGLRDDCVDHAMCLFSTLGMIKGRENRQQFLRHVSRILRPGGRFFLHVHNLWCNLFFPGGTRWLVGTALKSLRSKELELGDKYYPYRGLNNMFLHVFRRSEMVSALNRAGFRVLDVAPLSGDLGASLSHRWWFPRLRASGWWMVAEKQKPGPSQSTTLSTHLAK
jgi:SAM-dependent methyltransferase